jgi:hypothetical protein
MIYCTLITFVVLCLSTHTLSKQTVPQDNLTFKTIADHVNNYFSNQFNKILIIAKLSSIFGAKASFKATNHFSLHNRIKRNDNFSDTLSKFQNKLHHMLTYNKHILQYLNNATQTNQIQKQLCLIEAIEEILFSFESLSTELNSPAIVKRHALPTKLNQEQTQSPFLSALRFMNWQNFMQYIIAQTSKFNSTQNHKKTSINHSSSTKHYANSFQNSPKHRSNTISYLCSNAFKISHYF